MKQVFLYGLAGAEAEYRPVWYAMIPEDSFSVFTLIYEAQLMKDRNPLIEHVYAIDNIRNLKWDYFRALKGGIESRVIFKDILTSNGIQVL